jgi:hypothetical protein
MAAILKMESLIHADLVTAADAKGRKRALTFDQKSMQRPFFSQSP